MAGRPIRINSNQQFSVNGAQAVYEPGKRQFDRGATIGKTIPNNVSAHVPKSTLQQKSALTML